ncbi:MAG TPA: LDL receptor domain-containing protein, partial [Polyangiaceae bacterium]|nr:LDL receptor domain-containing protein [Polyangiaceae bacterium]
NGGGGTSGSGGTPDGATCDQYVEKLRGCGLVTGSVDCTTQDVGTYWPCVFGCNEAAPCGQIQDNLCGQSASNDLTECIDKCGNLTFTCGGGESVSAQFQCDGGEDCSNGKDEANCPTPSTTFSCENGTSVPASYHCDGAADCSDGSDEVDCLALTCPTPGAPPKTGEACTAAQTNLKSCGILPGGIMTSCLDRSPYSACQKQCFAKGACDDVVELFCDQNASSKNAVRLCMNDCLALPDQFSCQKDGTTIPLSWLCDGSDDCSDGTDELDCTFKCKSGDTVSYAYTCDGGDDCSDGSDEDGCGPTCEAPPPN